MIQLDKAGIERIIPHRAPFLLVDEVIELVPGERVSARKLVTDEECAGHFPGNPIMPGVKMVEALAQCGAAAVLSQAENDGCPLFLVRLDDVRFKRIVRPVTPSTSCASRGRPRARRQGEGEGHGRRRAGGARDADFRGGTAMTGRAAAGRPVTITGLGTYAPERVLSNDELSEFVDTSDEWIRARTGIRERRISAENELTSDVALSAARKALEDAGVEAGDIDLVIVGTISPDMGFPATAAIVADRLGCGEAAAYDVSAGCTGFMYALAQGHSAVVSGLSRRALVIGGGRPLEDPRRTDRSTLVLFGGRRRSGVLEATEESGFLPSTSVPTVRRAAAQLPGSGPAASAGRSASCR
jgi:3-hydroxymyristoyl/3-hydroxydecanoyl-(acyl carrier protein) dehydratase